MATPVKLDFVTLDVFTNERFLGNPLAVVLVPASAAASLSQTTKQNIAREFNLSETVFLHVPDAPDHQEPRLKMNIFTTEEELPFAGHPTIGTASLVQYHLKWPHITTLVPKAGPIDIQPRAGGGMRAAIPHDVHVHSNTLRSILAAPDIAHDVQAGIHNGLSEVPAIRQAELDAPFVSIVKGMTFLLVELPSLAELAQLRVGRRLAFDTIPGLLDAGAWERSFVGRYYYVRSAPDADAGVQRIRTRMMEMGVEDPATGSAACTLVSYLSLRGAEAEARFEVTQGVEMGRKSDIYLETSTEGEGEARKMKELYLGGEAVVVMSGSIQV